MDLTRRDFMKGAAAVVSGLAIGIPSTAEAGFNQEVDLRNLKRGKMKVTVLAGEEFYVVPYSSAPFGFVMIPRESNPIIERDGRGKLRGIEGEAYILKNKQNDPLVFSSGGSVCSECNVRLSRRRDGIYTLEGPNIKLPTFTVKRGFGDKTIFAYNGTMRGDEADQTPYSPENPEELAMRMMVLPNKLKDVTIESKYYPSHGKTFHFIKNPSKKMFWPTRCGEISLSF